MTTALHEAACNDQLATARLIILSGGHVDPLGWFQFLILNIYIFSSDKDQETPLMMAAQFQAFPTFIR